MIIVLAGVLLARYADKIAQKTGLGGMLVGSLLLAAVTSLTELTVGFNAIHINQPELAVGDLLGGSLINLFNLMLVSAYFNLDRKKVRIQWQQHTTAAVLFIALTALIAAGILENLETSFFRAGIFPWLVFFCYLAGI